MQIVTKFKDLVNRGGNKSNAIKGSIWTTLGHISTQFMRLGSNVILASLLFPAAFGLMALINPVIMGLGMMSDIGLGQSVIHSKRGEDITFLNTAWTLQVIRGSVLWFFTLLLAYPLSVIYEQPDILWLLPLAGLTAIIAGFQSISFFTTNRKLQLGKITKMDISATFIGISGMLIWAYFDSSSVLPLVAGSIMIALFKVIFSFQILEKHPHSFKIERAAAKELIHFGIWISLAAGLTFMSGRGMDMIQGALVPIETLGIIVIAGTMAWSIGELVAKIGMSVLFPVLASIVRDTPERAKEVFIRTRNPLLIISLLMFLLIAYLSPWITGLLYDERYIDIDVYLSILAINSGISVIPMFYSHALLAYGDSRSNFIIQVSALVTRISSTLFGFYLGGVEGMLLGLAIGSFLHYPVVIWRASEKCILLLKSDLSFYVIFILFSIMILLNNTEVLSNNFIY